MATWQEIGQDSLRAARALYAAKHYRSSISRFYYAAFSVLTDQLGAAGVIFGEEQETPNHKGLPKLMKMYLPLQTRQKAESIAIIRRLYSARIAADYQRRTIDETTARNAMRDAVLLFRQLGVDYETR